jgi:hypothetical protein
MLLVDTDSGLGYYSDDVQSFIDSNSHLALFWSKLHQQNYPQTMKKFFFFLLGTLVLQLSAVNTSYVDALNTFEAFYTKNTVSFKWLLTNPENVSGTFTIERSKDGKHFEKVSEVTSSLNGNGEVEFVDIDFKPGKKKTYYRLKFTDKNNIDLYSRILFVEKKSVKPKLHVSVSQDSQGIEFTKFKRDEKVLLVIRDKAGNEFYSKSIFMGKDNQLIIDKETQLAAGDYVIVASSQSGLYSNRFTIR